MEMITFKWRTCFMRTRRAEQGMEFTTHFQCQMWYWVLAGPLQGFYWGPCGLCRVPSIQFWSPRFSLCQVTSHFLSVFKIFWNGCKWRLLWRQAGGTINQRRITRATRGTYRENKGTPQVLGSSEEVEMFSGGAWKMLESFPHCLVFFLSLKNCSECNKNKVF